MMDAVTWTCLALGLAVGAWALWERLGRSANARAWSTSGFRGTARWTLVAKPGLSVCLLVGGCYPWLDRVPVLAGLGALAAVVGFLLVLVFGLFGVTEPAFVRPRWYRQQLAAKAARSRRKRS